MSTINSYFTNDIAQEPQQELSREQGKYMMQEDVDADNITLSGGDGGTRIIWSMDDYLDNDMNTNITVVQDFEQQLSLADQETQEESISVEEGGRSTKFDAEKDVDGQDNRGVLTGAVGPGIAARVQLLFRDEHRRIISRGFCSYFMNKK